MDRALSRIKLHLFLNVIRIPAFAYRVARALAKVERISQVLQFPVIIERRRMLSLEPEPS
jgi:hypothetical protein